LQPVSGQGRSVVDEIHLVTSRPRARQKRHEELGASDAVSHAMLDIQPDSHGQSAQQQPYRKQLSNSFKL
jgi:hypothetical protein